ncbi:MAG: hypothetical protein R3D00_11145 [Bacteroidia bacterium]
MQKLLKYLFVCLLGLFAPTSVILAQSWIKQLTYNFNLSGQIMTTTHDHGTVLCGTIDDQVNHDDLFVCKLDTTGTPIWQYTYSGILDIEGRTIQELADHGFIIQGNIPSGADKLIIRLDSAGQLLWAKKIEESGLLTSFSYSKMLETSAGHLLFTMYESLYTTYPSLVVLLNADGSIRWRKRISWGHEINLHSAVELENGDFLLYGQAWLSTLWDILLVRVDSSGNILGNYYFGRTSSSQRDVVLEIKPGTNGSLYMAGHTRQSGWSLGWGFLSKLDSNFNIVWAKRYGTSTSSTVIHDFQLTGDGIVAVGATDQIGNGGTDAWLLKTDSIGRILWQQTYGSSGNDEFQFVDILDSNTFWASGILSSPVYGAQTPVVALLDENQAMCNSGAGWVSIDTLIFVRNTLSGLTVSTVSNPIDAFSLTASSLNLVMFDPCQPLAAVTLYLEGGEKNGMVNVSAYSSLPEGRYILERSIIPDQWETILQGNWDRGNNSLQLTDPHPVPGLCLYRLRQTLDVREVQISNQVEIAVPEVQHFFVHTNESGYPVLDCVTGSQTSLRWSLLDLQGQVIYSGESGSITPGNYQWEFATRPLSPGIYLIRISDAYQSFPVIKWMRAY